MLHENAGRDSHNYYPVNFNLAVEIRESAQLNTVFRHFATVPAQAALECQTYRSQDVEMER